MQFYISTKALDKEFEGYVLTFRNRRNSDANSYMLARNTIKGFQNRA